MEQMELPFPPRIPFKTNEDGSLESDWFIVKAKDGKHYKTQIRISGVPTNGKESDESSN